MYTGMEEKKVIFAVNDFFFFNVMATRLTVVLFFLLMAHN